MAEIKESDIQNAESILIAFINETFPNIETIGVRSSIKQLLSHKKDRIYVFRNS